MYSFAHLGGRHLGVCRLGGAGLGNLLLPWARCRVATKAYGLRAITPTWEQLKLGPILRGERDLQNYSGLFQPMLGKVTGLKKWLLLRVAKRLSEAKFSPKQMSSQPFPKVLVFKGTGKFEAIIPLYRLLHNDLTKMTRPQHLSGFSKDFTGSISVHVRRGDFNQLSLGTPIAWYKSQIDKLRNLMGKQTKVFVCTDGTNDEIAALLAMSNVRRLDCGSSIADILALARANVLVATGGSSFSSWASFLGRMPVIWPPGTIQHNRLYFDNPELEIECSLEAAVPEQFLSKIQDHRCNATWD